MKHVFVPTAFELVTHTVYLILSQEFIFVSVSLYSQEPSTLHRSEWYLSKV